MSLKTFSCSCQSVGGIAAADAKNDIILEYPSTTNFEIIPFRPLKERLLDNKYPVFTYKYFEDIEKTLLESCNFEHINETLYYLERNPDIYDIVPRLLESISCELKKEGQQRVPILLKALNCLYINSVSDKSDFSICINALEHYLTKSSTFPGDYVVKDIAADILSNLCGMSLSDDLKEHLILQLSHVFRNPNCHSYNLYGGIVGCLSLMSAKSGAEVVPYDEFCSNTFLRNLLSSPRISRKLFYLCKPYIYSRLPSILIPRPLHNKNSFYDANSSCADVFNLMRNEMVTPISSVKYDHKFVTDYQFDGGWFETTNVPANCQDCDLVWPGFSAYQRAKRLEKNIDGECCSKSEEKGDTDIKNEKNSYTDCKSSYMDFDEVKDFQDESESSGNSESEGNLQVDSTSVSNTDDTDSERNFQADSNSSDDTDISIITIIEGKRNLQSDQLGHDWERPVQDDTKPIEHIRVQTNKEMMKYVDSQKAEKRNHRAEIESSQSVGFRSYEEYSDYLAWKRKNTDPVSNKWNKIGETLRLIPPPLNIDESCFEPPEVNVTWDTHIISTDYISEESLTAGGHCCTRSSSCANISEVCSDPPDLDIFKNLDKNMFANWKFKKPKSKKESPGAEKSDTRSQSQKKYKSRGKKRFRHL